MKNWTLILIASVLCAFSADFWGFYGHPKINRQAVFSLPPDMIGFYKANIQYLAEASVNPDRRRLAVVDEASRHYIDLDHYGDSAWATMPRYWKEAVAKFSEDTLKAYGIVPWHVNTMYYRLKDAFMVQDPAAILKISAELGHYIADANVPLHTTENYNGQLTNQYGIHGFWESRLPELFATDYNLFIGKAEYLPNPQLTIWQGIASAHLKVDSVLSIERSLSAAFGDRKYSFETRGKQTIKVYSQEFSKAYHTALNNMVERQLRIAIKMVADFWYTAWVDAGQPDLKRWIDYKPSAEELAQRREELKLWKEEQFKARSHEGN
ncbi:MAG: S1/P1 Nuclease [Cytophagia bacterium]|nr:S1/P1 Nuclease [Cytophagia bacterium]